MQKGEIDGGDEVCAAAVCVCVCARESFVYRIGI